MRLLAGIAHRLKAEPREVLYPRTKRLGCGWWDDLVYLYRLRDEPVDEPRGSDELTWGI